MLDKEAVISFIHNIKVPFSKDIYGGLAKATGLMGLSKEGVVLEFEIGEAIFDSKLIKSDVKYRVIPFREIDYINLKKGLFFTTLTIRTKGLKALSDIPGSHQAEVKFRIPRKCRNIASEFVSCVVLKISEHEIEKIQGQNLNLLDS